MTKNKIIESIIEASKIHHNIRIDCNKMPGYTDEDNFDYNFVADELLEMFISDFELLPMNDCGNRNLCSCRKNNPKNILKNGACKQHDLWHIYSHGRMGATLYWDKYWISNNSGFGFKYDEEELKEMGISELKTILKEINCFNKLVRQGMADFYSGCAYQLKDARKRKEEEEKEEKLYQKTLKVVKNNQFIKRLLTDCIE